MKKCTLIILGLLFTFNLIANDNITEAVNKFKSINKIGDYYEVLNDFERIIEVNDNSWICYYYSSLCLLNIAMNSPLEKIDEICDKADGYIDKADELNPNNSEIYCLKALSVSIRIRVDGQNRGYKYVTLSNSYLQKAEAIDSLNPRVYYLKARNTENIPESLGGGLKEATKLYEKALVLFEKQYNDTILPTWGYSICKNILDKQKK